MSLNNKARPSNNDLATDAYADFITRRGAHLSGVVAQNPEGFADGTVLPPPLDLTTENGEHAQIAAYAKWYAALNPDALADGAYSAKMGPRFIKPPAPFEQ